MKLVVLELSLEVSKFKSGEKFYCRCDEYDLTGCSKKGFEEALERLFDELENKIWSQETLEIKFKVDDNKKAFEKIQNMFRL